MKFDIHKKEQEGLLYENGIGKKIVGHSKLKLQTFFWGHGEREWPLPIKGQQWQQRCQLLFYYHVYNHSATSQMLAYN